MFEDKNNWLHGLAWFPTGKSVAINSSTPNGKLGSIEFIRLLSVTGKPNSVRVLALRAWTVEGFGSDVAFSADGNYIADARHVVHTWRVPSGKEAVMIRQSSSSSGDRIRFSPDGKILAMGGHRAVVFWDVAALHTTVVEK